MPNPGAGPDAAFLRACRPALKGRAKAHISCGSEGVLYPNLPGRRFAALCKKVRIRTQGIRYLCTPIIASGEQKQIFYLPNGLLPCVSIFLVYTAGHTQSGLDA